MADSIDTRNPSQPRPRLAALVATFARLSVALLLVRIVARCSL